MYGYDSVRLSTSVVGSGEVVPSVMLSPKARKRTDDNTGTAETITEKPHVPDRPRESVAVQVTRVVPSGNAVPDAGAQVVVTGALPPAATGVSNATTGGWPCRADAWMSAGHVRVGAGTGGSGLVGESPQELRHAASTSQRRWRHATPAVSLSNTSGLATVFRRPASSRGHE